MPFHEQIQRHNTRRLQNDKLTVPEMINGKYVYKTEKPVFLDAMNNMENYESSTRFALTLMGFLKKHGLIQLKFQSKMALLDADILKEKRGDIKQIDIQYKFHSIQHFVNIPLICDYAYEKISGLSGDENSGNEKLKELEKDKIFKNIMQYLFNVSDDLKNIISYCGNVLGTASSLAEHIIETRRINEQC